MDLLSFRKFRKKEEKTMADFTVLYDDCHIEHRQAGTKMDLLRELESTGADYIEVLDGVKNIPPRAIQNFKNNPMGILLSQINTPPENIKPKIPLPPATPSEDVAVQPVEPKIVEAPIEVEQEQVERKIQFVKPEPPQFFEEDGIKFKVVNGEVFRKSWKKDVDNKARIVNTKTGKEYTGSQYEVEIEDWVSVFKN